LELDLDALYHKYDLSQREIRDLKNIIENLKDQLQKSKKNVENIQGR
jgi:hemerythrin superfamily protein